MAVLSLCWKARCTAKQSFQSMALTALSPGDSLLPGVIQRHCVLSLWTIGGQIVIPKQGVAEEPAAGLLPFFSAYEKS